MLDDSMIICPVCDGNKLSPFGGGYACRCCGGKGSLTKKRYDAIMSVRKDLKRKLRERNIL